MADVTIAARRAPDFAIVGAAKAGTTSLHSYLAQHPRIAATVPKETFHFVREEIEACTGIGAGYAPRPIPRDAADYATRFVPPDPSLVWGESCVAYLYFAAAAARIAAANPECRIVILLRDPIERAYSNYLHHVRDGFERLDFRTAMAAGEERVRRGWWFGFDYAGGSRYAEQIARFRARFTADRVRILWYEDLCTRPEVLCREIFGFVGVDPTVRVNVQSELNVSTVPRPMFRPLVRGLDTLGVRLRNVMSRRKYKRFARAVRRAVSHKPELSADDRRALVPSFVDDVRRVEEMTGRDLARWRTP